MAAFSITDKPLIPSFRVRAPLGRSVCGGVVCALFFLWVCGCTSKVVGLREVHNPKQLLPPNVDAFGHLEPTATAELSLSSLRLDKESGSNLEKLVKIQEAINAAPDLNLLSTFCELGYYEAVRVENSDPEYACELYAAILFNSWRYLFDPEFEIKRNTLGDDYKRTASYYNKAAERLLRRLFRKREGEGRPTPAPGDDWVAGINGKYWRVACVMGESPWRGEEVGTVRFASDYEVEGLTGRYTREGIGIPVIVSRKRCGRSEENYYITDLSYPMTLILRPNAKGWLSENRSPGMPQVFLEFLDPLAQKTVAAGSSTVPLAADLTTPIAYNYIDPRADKIGTLGLLHPESFFDVPDGEEGVRSLAGFYMAAPYDPEKIPIILVHGLWSSPMTWVPLLSALQDDPEIWQRYQFWLWCYPTGYPWWVSASRLRSDLNKIYTQLDPEGTNPCFKESVIIGHSMGGLISSLQVLESGDEVWKLVSDEPFEESRVKNKEELRPIFFFHPDPRITRIVTIATPYRGSDSVNSFVKWFADKAISSPEDLHVMSEWLNTALGTTRNPIIDTKNSVESLSPGSPFFEALSRMRRPDYLAFNNIIGVTETGLIVKRNVGDKIVPYESAHRGDADSEFVIDAFHTRVHSCPAAAREAKRILREHYMTALRRTLPPARLAAPPSYGGGALR